MEEDQPLCLICHDFIDTENNYTLPECKHKYHTKCIIEWFKRGDNRCPYCQNRGINNEGIILDYPYTNSCIFKTYFYPSWRNKKWWSEESKNRYQMGSKKIKEIKNYIRKNNNHPKWLADELNNLCKEEKDYKKFLDNVKEYKKNIKHISFSIFILFISSFFLNISCWYNNRII